MSVAALALNVRAHDVGERLQPPWQRASDWPDRIVLTLPGDPSAGFAVTWRTDASVAAPIAQIAPATSDARFDLAARTQKGVTTAVRLDQVEHRGDSVPVLHNHGLPTVFYHTVEFDGLKPNKPYAYRVRGAAGKFSPWRHVRTAPKSGPVTFLFFGDAQRGIRSHVTRVFDQAARTAPDAHFALHAGDLVNTAMYDLEWAEWFEAVGNTHRVTPIVPVAGNHDYMNLSGEKLFASTDKRVSPLWRPQFALPVEAGLPAGLHETVYELRYSDDLHLFVLDSSGVAFDAQLEWLSERLSASTARWRVLTMHHPLFSFVGGNEHPSHRERRLALLRTLETHDIDLVLCGHRHTYQRGDYGDDAARFAVGRPHKVRTVFVVTASCVSRGVTKVEGWRRYSEQQSGAFSLTRYADNTPLFATVRIDRGELRFAAYDSIGEVYDRFTIEKLGAAGSPEVSKRVVNGPEANGPIKDYNTTGEYRDWDDLRQ